MLQILAARDEAENHRLRDPPLLRAHREVDVRDDEADQMDAASTRPAIQCHCTQANFTPAIGRNAVKSSTNIAAAITQWNSRAVRPWRSIAAGRSLCAASSASVSAAVRLRCAENSM